MSETPGGNEIVSPSPKGNDRADGKPGYPPVGQAETLAAIKAKEASAKENPESILAELEASETPEARNARLGQFVETHFSDICPTENMHKAVERCQMFEDDCRELFEEPDLKLSEEDATDPELKEKIIKAASQVASNETAIANAEETKKPKNEMARNNATKIETGEIQIGLEKSKTPTLKNDVASAERVVRKEKFKEAEKEADLNTISADEKIINENYPEPLKSEKNGTIRALYALKDMVKNPKTVEKINQILAKLQNVSKLGTTPEAQNFFQQAVQQSDVDLSASSPNQIYASLISNIDAGLASGAITQSDANAARVSLGVSPKTTNEPYKIPKDSSQMARDLRERRNTEKQVPKIDPATGEPMVDEDGNIIYETITKENNDVIPIDHPSLEIYLKPEPGSDAYDVHILSDSRLPLVERIDANNFAMGGMREINYLVATADMEQQGFTDMFGSQFTSNEVRRHNFNNFMRATGMNPDFGSLWTTEHSDRIRQMMQMLHPRGDLGRDDVNPDNWKERATELGVYDQKTDQWDYDALSLMRNSKTFDTVGKDGEALLRSGEVGS